MSVKPMANVVACIAQGSRLWVLMANVVACIAQGSRQSKGAGTVGL
jgi:hypothetical protein